MLILIVPLGFIVASVAVTVYGLKKLKEERTGTSGSETSDGASKTKRRLVISCEKCNKKLRVPMVEGKIKVTCPTCKHSFAHEA